MNLKISTATLLAFAPAILNAQPASQPPDLTGVWGIYRGGPGADPKFRPPRYAQYLRAVDAIGHLAQERFGKSVLALAIRWVLDQPGVHVALWGARSPEQVTPVDEAIGWSLDAAAKQAVDVILRETVTDPVGPEFMAPPAGAVGVPVAPRATA